MEKMKPCPFCGRLVDGVTIDKYGFFVTVCSKCKASGPRSLSIDSADEAWNKRAKDTPAVDNWISVRDRLPDNIPCEYLVVNYGVVGTAIFLNGTWIAPTTRVNITHWMPLPEPPKENQ